MVSMIFSFFWLKAVEPFDRLALQNVPDRSCLTPCGALHGKQYGASCNERKTGYFMAYHRSFR